MLASRREAMDLVIVDMDRAGWQETLTRVRGLSTRIPVAVLSGNPEDAFARGVTGPGMVEIIRKTHGPEAIGESVGRIIGRSASVAAVGGMKGGHGPAA